LQKRTKKIETGAKPPGPIPSSEISAREITYKIGGPELETVGKGKLTKKPRKERRGQFAQGMEGKEVLTIGFFLLSEQERAARMNSGRLWSYT